jgi:hypothetical protein
MIRSVVIALLLGLGASNAFADDVTPPAPKAVPGKGLPFAPPPPPISVEEGVLCAADIKLCPDGSRVIRNPAQACAFDLCPGEPQP